MEKHVESHLVKQTKAIGGKALKFPPFFFRGIPDRLLLIPRGLIVWVETKQKGGVLAPMQIRRIDKFRQWGFWVEVIWSKEQVDELIDKLRLL